MVENENIIHARDDGFVKSVVKLEGNITSKVNKKSTNDFVMNCRGV